MTRTARAAALTVSAVAVSLVAALLTGVLTAGPALAGHLGDDSSSRPEVGLQGALVLYVLLPAVILLGMAGLVLLPGVVRNDRYRPQRGWSAAPLWFSGPPDPDSAVAAASPGDVVRGGAGGKW